MKSIIALMVSLALVSTALAKEDISRFVGSYYRGDGLGYNVTLDLSVDGTYVAVWRGCLGEYGTAEGSWKIAEEMLVLHPSKETEMMQGHLTVLKIRRHWRTLSFLPEREDQKLKSEKENEMVSFKKRDEKKKA